MKSYVTRPIQVVAKQLKDSDFSGDHPNENHEPMVTYDPVLKTAVWMCSPHGGVGHVGDWLIKNPVGHNYIQSDLEFRSSFKEDTSE